MEAMGLLLPYGLVEGLPLYGVKVVSDAYPVPGRVVLLTDATEGVGPSVARGLAARGAKLALTGTDPVALARLAGPCGEAAAWFEVDLREADQLTGAVEGTVRRFGALDVVVAHAHLPPAASDAAGLRDAVDDNLRKTAAALRGGLPHVVQRRGYALRVVPVEALLLDPAHRKEVAALARELRAKAEPYGARVGVAYFADPSPQTATGAIIRAIERRARRVAAPRWTRVMVAAPRLLPRRVKARLAPPGVFEQRLD
jgi:NAD(P)-dependent dehydrogenase (short-subunit alcohol dehydrogenase family)